MSIRSSVESGGVGVGGSRVGSEVPEVSEVTGARWTVGEGRRTRRSVFALGFFLEGGGGFSVEGRGWVGVEGGVEVFVFVLWRCRSVRAGGLGGGRFGGASLADKAVLKVGALGTKSGALVLKENGCVVVVACCSSMRWIKFGAF